MFDRLKLAWRLWGTWDHAVAAVAREDPMNAKSIFQSWTLWFNLGYGIFETLQLAGVFDLIPSPWNAFVPVVANILLRFKTNGPVTLGSGGK